MANAARMVGALGSPQRLRVVAALILGATTRAEVRAATGARRANRAPGAGPTGRVGRGRAAEADGRFVGGPTELAEAARAVAKASGRRRARPGRPTREEKVRRAFLKDGAHVDPVAAFEAPGDPRRAGAGVRTRRALPGARGEPPFARWHPDVAALRRYLVDEGFMERDHGEYWRAGGTFEL